MDHEDRRAHSRLDRVHKVFVQVVDTEQQPTGPLLRCTCENVSSTGVGLTLIEPIPTGAQIELWINVDDAEARFLLGGVVRWCRPAVHRCLYEIGVELTRGAGEEFDRWAEMWATSLR